DFLIADKYGEWMLRIVNTAFTIVWISNLRNKSIGILVPHAYSLHLDIFCVSTIALVKQSLKPHINTSLK
ncbi:hypothetical protein B2J68_19895, partial [Vibrio cholerae]